MFQAAIQVIGEVPMENLEIRDSSHLLTTENIDTPESITSSLKRTFFEVDRDIISTVDQDEVLPSMPNESIAEVSARTFRFS